MNKIATILRESAFARFLIPVGLLLIIFGIITFVITLKNQNYVKVDAVVTNVITRQEEVVDNDGTHMEETYDVSFKYTVDGKEYNDKFDGISKYNVGDKMTIYYNPSNPKEITQTKSLLLPVIIFAFGIASFVGGIISAINAIKKHKKMKEQEKGWENE